MNDPTRFKHLIQKSLKKHARNARDLWEDLEQECLIELFQSSESINELSGEDQMKFIFTVCRNTILNVLEKSGRMNTQSLSDWRVQNEAEHRGVAPELGIERNELDEAIGRLTLIQQYVIRRAFMEGQTLQELAKDLGKSRYAIDRIKQGAIQELRKILEVKA